MNNNRRPLTENISIKHILNNIKIPEEGLSLIPCELDVYPAVIFDNRYFQQQNEVKNHEFTFR